MRRLPLTIAAFPVALVVTAAASAENDADASASAASRFAAIVKFCAEAIPTDKVEAARYMRAFDDVGQKIEGPRAWNKRMNREVLRRLNEVRVVGTQRWCEDQRRYLRELGDKKVFP